VTRLPTPASDDAQRARLARLKVRAAAHHVLDEGTQLHDADLGARAAAVHDGAGAVVLVDSDDRHRGLGGAVAWAAKAGLDGDLHVVTEGDPAILARLAGHLARPPRIWRLVGTALHPVTAEPWRSPTPPTPADFDAIAPLVTAGAELVVEDGIVRAEVLGLEVGRVVAGALEIGVGRFDREAAAVMEAVRGRDDLISGVVEVVRRYRHPRAEPHALNRLARERWLRADLVANPAPAGAVRLEPVEPTIARDNLTVTIAAPARGIDRDGAPVVVATTVGVDLDAVLVAADSRAAHDPGAALVVALPARDRYPALERLAAALAKPARLVAVDGAWKG
jgi:hypothetical protein